MRNQNIYTMVDELIKLLKQDGHQGYASALEFRMYKVSWTSGYELIESVTELLKKIISENNSALSNLLISEIKNLLAEAESGGDVNDC